MYMHEQEGVLSTFRCHSYRKKRDVMAAINGHKIGKTLNAESGVGKETLNEDPGVETSETRQMVPLA